MRPARGFMLAVAMALTAGGVRGGDPDVADLLLKKAKKAFAAKGYEEAETGFRRALKEMTPFPDARLGLAESLEKLDRPREAIEEYRTCVAEIDEAGAPARWKALKTRAQQALSRLQGRHAELAKLNDAFIRKCIEFGRKYAKSDPPWARKALEAALLLDPGNEVARGLLKTLPAAESAAEPQAKKPAAKEERPDPTLYRRDLWDGAPEWSVESDTITGDVREKDGRLFWLTDMPLSGKYTIRGRCRLTRDGGNRRAYGILVGGDGKMRFWAVMLSDHEEIVLDRFDNGPPTQAEGFILESFDHAAWHTLRIDVEPGAIVVLLNGKEVLRHADKDPRAFDGQMCLYVQNACIEWKDLEVTR